MTLTETTTVCDLLTQHPETFDAFRRHGMCEDCKADPPPVALHHFARKHCGGTSMACDGNRPGNAPRVRAALLQH